MFQAEGQVCSKVCGGRKQVECPDADLGCHPGNMLGLGSPASLKVGVDTWLALANGMWAYTCVSFLGGSLKGRYVICHALFSQSVHHHPCAHNPTIADTCWMHSMNNKLAFALLRCWDLGFVCCSSLTYHILTYKEGQCNWQWESKGKHRVKQGGEIFRGQIVKSFVTHVKEIWCHPKSKGKSLKDLKQTNKTDFTWRKDGKEAK